MCFQTALFCVFQRTLHTFFHILNFFIRENLTCPLPLSTLDFIYNLTQPNLETIWPCEVRYYWLSLQPFVKFVRFLLGYITPLIIILGKKNLIFIILCFIHWQIFIVLCCIELNIISAGVLFNTISFGMLSTPILCESNLSLYLKALALSDNGALIFTYAVGIAKSHFTFINNLFMVSN